MAANDHRSNHFRVFEKETGAIAGVTFSRDSATSPIRGEVDQQTGVIQLASAFLYGQFKTVKEANEKRKAGRAVTWLNLEVAKRASDDRLLVTQRVQGDRYIMSANVSPYGDDLELYSFAPTAVRMRERSEDEQAELGLGPLAVWADTQMGKDASNRADLWRVEKSGRISLFSVLIVTLDDGKTFQIPGEYRWEGQLYRRTRTAPYELVSDDERTAVVFGNDEVRQLLNKYVFVPDEGYENIEKRLQILLLPEFRALIGSTSAEPWEGPEDFWLKPEPRVGLIGQQGLVEFYAHGLADGSFGIVRLATPIMVGGKLRDKAQIKHRFLDAETDVQGLKLVRAGDIVEYAGFYDMDQGKREYPPLLLGAKVIYQYLDLGAA